MDNIKRYINRNGKQIFALVGVFLVVGALLNVNVFDFQANVLAGKKSAPFDGTVLPVQKAPSWVDLSSDQWKMAYSQLPSSKIIDLPEYIPSQLATPSSSLNYSKAEDRAIRNAQVTFSVPYMGNYKLDGQEYAGSHLGVDIKVPMGTPVYAIANGVVIKSTNQPGGYGQYVVLRHDDVPSLNDSNQKTTYYSGYGHMSKLMVSEGDIVTKGTQIGESGNSGTATTPHVHFQIDNDQAPWHLYWPFTSKEASDAGLGFFEAINAGLGKDKAIAATISPMVYVQKYKSGLVPSNNGNNVDQLPSSTGTSSSASNSVTNNAGNTSVTNDQLPPAITTNSNIIVPAVDNSTSTTTTSTGTDTVVAPEVGSIKLKYDKGFVINAEKIIKVMVLDKSGNVITNFKPDSELAVRLDNGSAKLDRSYLTASDFSGGMADIKLTPTAGFGIKITVTYKDMTDSTDVLQETGFADLSQNSDEFVAVNFLRNNNVVKGYPDGTFKPQNDISRVESLKFIYEGLHKDISGRAFLEFSDTDSSAWYAKYVAAAQREGVVKGYANNQFKPANAVTKAEFLKMLIESAGYNAVDYVSASPAFADITPDAWYANYVALAKDKNIIDTSSSKFFPNQPITRGEVAQILYKIIVMKTNDKTKFDSSLVVNEDQAKQFYNI